MGVYVCAWVMWDPGDTAAQKNKTSRDKNGYLGHDLGSMAGEISPDIMFWEIRPKMLRMSADG